MTSQHIQKTLEAFDRWLKMYFTQIPLSEEVIEKMKQDISRHVSQALTEQHEADVRSFRDKVEGLKKKPERDIPSVAPNVVYQQRMKIWNETLDYLLASLDEEKK